ncbi:hypothetical protein J2T57_001255 [Natronocella acetinitrilica]|uniref:Uncharacterized protein n=1 Tax=Natronocella acetinitrilica TaxID=414046 RepID=A0AAE3G2V6_9GAMM|nr:hypothetical protein [Natronocella acetinitrilica]MCP1674153.1 hypothetical protein [Natronocella acetinitrilica]
MGFSALTRPLALAAAFALFLVAAPAVADGDEALVLYNFITEEQVLISDPAALSLDEGAAFVPQLPETLALYQLHAEQTGNAVVAAYKTYQDFMEALAQ